MPGMGKEDYAQRIEEKEYEKSAVELIGTGAGTSLDSIRGNKDDQGKEQQQYCICLKDI